MDRDQLKAQVKQEITHLLSIRDELTGAARTDLLAQINKLEDVLRDIRNADADQLVVNLGAAVDELERVRTKHSLDAVSVLSRAIEGLAAAEVSINHEPQVKASPGSGLTGPEAVAAATAGAAAAAAAAKLNQALGKDKEGGVAGTIAGTVAASVAGVVVAAAATRLIKTLKATNYADLKDEYQTLFNECVIRPDKQGLITRLAKRVSAGKSRYESVGDPLRIPWKFIGVIHALEAGLNFDTHLHNGDPLTARTTHVPKGMPKSGSPPFTWEESAIDALTSEKLDQNRDWSTAHMLYLLEGFNGYGYRKFQIPSPYLWSFSNLYQKGKFVQDGVFDAASVSKQCGAAVLLKALG